MNPDRGGSPLLRIGPLGTPTCHLQITFRICHLVLLTPGEGSRRRVEHGAAQCNPARKPPRGKLPATMVSHCPDTQIPPYHYLQSALSHLLIATGAYTASPQRDDPLSVGTLSPPLHRPRGSSEHSSAATVVHV